MGTYFYSGGRLCGGKQNLYAAGCQCVEYFGDNPLYLDCVPGNQTCELLGNTVPARVYLYDLR